MSESRIRNALEPKCCTERILALLLPSSLPRCPGGGIGRRARLKLAFRKECGFDSHPGYKKASHCAGLFLSGTARAPRAYLAWHDAFVHLQAMLGRRTSRLDKHTGLRPGHREFDRPAARRDHLHLSECVARLWSEPRIHRARVDLGLF